MNANPGKYHRVSKGKLVDRWNFTTPKEVNGYLNSVWACIWADLTRKGIEYFGIRVAEPHHDGTPHWHMLIYTKGQENYNTIKTSLQNYNLAVDGDEQGAEKARIKVKPIDERVPSASLRESIFGRRYAHSLISSMRICYGTAYFISPGSGIAKAAAAIHRLA